MIVGICKKVKSIYNVNKYKWLILIKLGLM